MKENKLLDLTKECAVKYLFELPERRVLPDKAALRELEKLSVPLPVSSTGAEEVLEISGLNDR